MYDSGPGSELEPFEFMALPQEEQLRIIDARAREACAMLQQAFVKFCELKRPRWAARCVSLIAELSGEEIPVHLHEDCSASVKKFHRRFRRFLKAEKRRAARAPYELLERLEEVDQAASQLFPSANSSPRSP